MGTTIQDSIFTLFVYGPNGLFRINSTAPFGKPYSGSRVNKVTNDAGKIAADKYAKELIMNLEKLGFEKAELNTVQAEEMLQLAKNAIDAITLKLERLRELAADAVLDSEADRASLKQAAADLIAEIDEIARDTEYRNRNLLDGSLVTAVGLGIREEDGDILFLKLANARASRLGKVTGENSLNELDGGVADLSTQAGGRRALEIVENAIADTHLLKSDVNAYQTLLGGKVQKIAAEMREMEGEGNNSEKAEDQKWAVHSNGTMYNQSGKTVEIQGVMVPDSMLSLLG